MGGKRVRLHGQPISARRKPCDRIAEPGRAITLEEILHIASDVSRGLGHIHEHGILYRDLQPRNVLFDEQGNARLVDFDIACTLDDSNTSDIST